MTDSSVGNVMALNPKREIANTNAIPLSQTLDGVLVETSFGKIQIVNSITVQKTFRFEASHFLPDHDGKCQYMHGHSYKVEVQFSGSLILEGPERGMVRDFGKVKTDCQIAFGHLDHQCLNDYFEVPTAEVLAVTFLVRLRKLDPGYGLVKVWETDDSCAIAAA